MQDTYIVEGVRTIVVRTPATTKSASSTNLSLRTWRQRGSQRASCRKHELVLASSTNCFVRDSLSNNQVRASSTNLSLRTFCFFLCFFEYMYI